MTQTAETTSRPRQRLSDGTICICRCPPRLFGALTIWPTVRAALGRHGFGAF
jgi:hypothetical protein